MYGVPREEAGWYSDDEARELLGFISRDDLLEGVFDYLTCRMASPDNCKDVFNNVIRMAEIRREAWMNRHSDVI